MRRQFDNTFERGEVILVSDVIFLLFYRELKFLRSILISRPVVRRKRLKIKVTGICILVNRARRTVLRNGEAILNKVVTCRSSQLRRITPIKCHLASSSLSRDFKDRKDEITTIISVVLRAGVSNGGRFERPQFNQSKQALSNMLRARGNVPNNQFIGMQQQPNMPPHNIQVPQRQFMRYDGR